MDDNDSSRAKRYRAADTRDNRTGEGELPQGDPVRPPMTSSEADEALPLPMLEDPVNAVNPTAWPSDYSMRDIDEGETPLGEGMDRLIDPSISEERLSNNPDVLDLDSSYFGESEEPDFAEDPGTTDVIEVVEEGATYFPPTDPPNMRRHLQGADVLGGFSGSSDEEPNEPEEHPNRVQGNDEELAEQVRYALSADSYTSELEIEVEVENGVAFLRGKVSSLDDIEQAEQVAGSVPGIEDVDEELEIV